MPSKKKKYNARFPAGRIKKIMQTDEEVGKVAQAVPVMISRTLELFVESLLTKSTQITQARNAKTLTPSHMKQCILSESRFDFLKDLVSNIPDASAQEDNENNLLYDASLENREPSTRQESSPSTSGNLNTVTTYASNEPSSSSSSKRKRGVGRPKGNRQKAVTHPVADDEDTDVDDPEADDIETSSPAVANDNIPSLIPLSNNTYSQSKSDSLVIDEDYDN